jgi:RNA polymerase sigma factor FliA
MMKHETAEQYRTAETGVRSGYSTSAEDLVRTHQALVRKQAWLVHGRAARSAELDDLVQVGMIALIEASRTYQDQGHSFATYATIRVRGAMVDHVRRETPVGRAAVPAAGTDVAPHAGDQRNRRRIGHDGAGLPCL